MCRREYCRERWRLRSCILRPAARSTGNASRVAETGCRRQAGDAGGFDSTILAVEVQG